MLYYLILFYRICVVPHTVVGLILVIALFTIPASNCRALTRRLSRIMIIARGLAWFSQSRTFPSFYFNLTSGATIILVAGISYFLALVVKSIQKKKARFSPGPVLQSRYHEARHRGKSESVHRLARSLAFSS